MANRSYKISLDEAQRGELCALAAGSRPGSRMAIRAKIVLKSADGESGKGIAKDLDTSPQTVSFWRRRFVEEGIAGLHSRPKIKCEKKIPEATTREIIKRGSHREDGATCRSVAAEFGVSKATVQRIWSEHGLDGPATMPAYPADTGGNTDDGPNQKGSYILWALNEWLCMIQQHQEAMKEKLADASAEGEPDKSSYVEPFYDYADYNEEELYHRPSGGTYAVDDPVDLPVHDLVRPPENPIEGRMVDYVLVSIHTARYIQDALNNVLAVGPSAFPSEPLPVLEPEETGEDLDSVLKALRLSDRAARDVNTDEDRRQDEIRSTLLHRKLMLRRLGIRDWLSNDRLTVLARDCSFERVRQTLCMEARKVMRYRYGFNYDSLPLLLESLATDALLTLQSETKGVSDGETGEGATGLREAVSQILGADMNVIDTLSRNDFLRDGETIHSRLYSIDEAILPPAAREAFDTLRNVISAWTAVSESDPSETALQVYRAIRHHYALHMIRWGPLAVDGTKEKRRLANSKRRSGDQGISRDELIVIAHEVQKHMRRDPPLFSYKGAVEEASNRAIHPSTDRRIFKRDPNGVPIDGDSYGVRRLIQALSKRLGMNAKNAKLIELPPLPLSPPEEAERQRLETAEAEEAARHIDELMKGLRHPIDPSDSC